MNLLQRSFTAIPWDALVFLIGMITFGINAHQDGIADVIGLICLSVAGLMLAIYGFAKVDAQELLGFSKPKWTLRYIGLLLLPVGIGLLLAVCYRYMQKAPLLPSRLTPIASVALAVGICEEIAYRGYVYGRFRSKGIVLAAVLAAAGHALYKSSLFLMPPEGVHPDVPVLFIWTFMVGLLFAVMREYLGGTIMPLTAHAVFDIIVYGDAPRSPWWVFS